MVTIDNQYFSVSQICRSGQCFRLDPVKDGFYELIAGSRFLRIKAGDGGKAEKTVLYCSRKEYESFWREYFDMYAYEKFHNGEMSDYIPTDEDLKTGFDGIPRFPGNME